MKYQLASRFRIALSLAVALSLLLSITAPSPIASAALHVATYTVTYNGNGGAGSVPTDSTSYAEGATVTVAGQNGLSRSGYTFGGWSYSGSMGPQVVTSFSIFSNTTLTAVWNLNPTQTVYFFPNGGIGSMTTQSSNIPANLTSNPYSRTGYTFSGWNTAAGGGGTSYTNGFNYNFTAVLDLYAQWTLNATYTVTYAGNGESGGAVPTDLSSPYTSGATVAVATTQNTLYKTGYTFGGWSYSGGMGSQVVTSFSIFSNTTLTAVWTLNATYTVTYVGNTNTGGSVPTDSTAYASGAPVTVAGQGTLVKTGSTFGGWATGGGLSPAVTYQPNQTFTITSNTTLTAVWNVNPATYTVTYVGNTNTTGSVPSPTIGSGSITLRTNTGLLAKTGYSFGGWNTQANGLGINRAIGSSYNLTSNITLYAKWTAGASYTITYLGNTNSSGSAPSPTIGSGLVTLPTNSGLLLKTGFTFGDWNTQANGLGVNRAAGSSYNLTSNITLYAKWTPITNNGVQVYFRPNGGTPSFAPIQASYIPTTLNPNIFTHILPGFTFVNWNTAADGTGTSYADTAIYSFNAFMVLYAQWRPTATPTYTVTYLDSGKTSGSAPVDVLNPYSSGAVVFVLSAGSLAKTGYTLTGWTNCATSQPVGTSFVILANTDLCPIWTPNPKFTVTYNGNGKTGGSVPNPTTGSGVVTLANNSGSLVKSGDTFGGWNSKANGLGIPYAVGSPYNLIADVTLYAVWIPAKTVYTITYDGNGNSGGLVPSPKVGAGSVLLAVNSGALVKISHHLGGWNTKVDGSGITYPLGNSYNLITNVTLFALWSPDTYTITYDGNGSTGGVVPNPMVGSGSVTLAYNSGALVNTGNSYNNWNMAADGSGTAYVVGSPYTLNADVTLYAVWVPKTFTVTYDGNGFTGGAVPIDPTAYFSGGTVIVLGPNTLVKAGFTFGGWALGSFGIYTPGQTFPITGDVTLTAVWTPNIIYTITYNGNGFTGGTVPSPTVGSGPVTLATNSGSLVKSGSLFGGWNTTNDGSGTPYAAGSPYTLNANITLYALWLTGINSYTITYVGNGSTGGSVPSPTVGAGSVTLAINSGSLVKVGSVFGGWNTKVDGSGIPYGVGSNYNLIANITLYAVWIPVINVYTITYSGNGYTGGTAPSPTIGSGSVTLATNNGSLSKSANTFGGWNASSNGSGTPYAVGSNYTLLADITLYAVWSPINTLYTITYLGNTNTGGVAPQATVGLGSVTLATNNGPLVKSGSAFGGWNTSASGIGTPYSVASNYTLVADVVLYAMWSGGNTLYTVTYMGNGNTSGVAPIPTVGIGSVTLASNGGLLAKSGYVFGGWNSKADGSGTSYPVSGNYNLVANVTMYALWSPYISFTITYLGNSNTSGSVPAPTVGTGLVTLSQNTGGLSKTGSTFGGWNTKANRSGTSYLVGTTYDLTSNITLYAIFIGAPIVEIPPDLIANGKIGASAPPKKIALNQIVPVHQQFLTVLPSNAIGFELYHNGKFIARGTGNSYDLQQIVGPKDRVTVQSVGKDGLKSPQAAVSLSKDPISLANINFNTDSYKFIGIATSILDQVAAVMIQHGYTRLDVYGYVDTQGSKASWITLSNNRAKAVKNYMTKKLKGTGITIVDKGRAQTQAVGNNKTAAGRALNRRVEIRVS